ncbi:MAG: xanthine dehydrogenase family protein molybdopterin-binding subunit [Alphaproteobacteria bacterium]|nr:xanthine dehydrogenase family protein molybdopterin-binding subunit [Alphaproteobacteria bacterium]
MSDYNHEITAKITGRAIYVSDATAPNLRYAAFVRSPVAAARLTRLELPPHSSRNRTENPIQSDKIICFTATDWPHLTMPPANPMLPMRELLPHPVLAGDFLAYIGQPVALVVAPTLEAAINYAESVQIHTLPAHAEQMADYATPVIDWQVKSPDNAPEFAPLQNDDIKVAFHQNQARLVAMAMETHAILVEWDAASAILTVTIASQTPSRAYAELLRLLPLKPEQIRVKTAYVGGAFGGKSSMSPEEIAVIMAAAQLKCAIHWMASRSEEITCGMQGRGGTINAQLHTDQSGNFTALTAQLDFPLGAFPAFSAAAPIRNAARILPGPYKVKSVELKAEAHLTPTPPVTIYRGAGRPEACMMMEILIERAARRLKCDPVQLRKQNLLSRQLKGAPTRAKQPAIPRTSVPFATPGGLIIEDGDFLSTLDEAARLFDYKSLRRAQTQRRQAGEIIGIGTGFYLEPCGQGYETARLVWGADGVVTIACPSPCQGQGHSASYAAIAAEILQLPLDQIRVLNYDSLTHPSGIGALASRSTAIGGSAIAMAAIYLHEQRLADTPLPLTAEIRYDAPAEAISHGCAIAMIQIDRDTGEIKIERMALVDDAARIIVPELAKGQIMGGIAQGIGQALYEAVRCDDNGSQFSSQFSGQILSGSLMDYALPRCSDMPQILTAHRDSVTAANRLGAKGVGEAGTIGTPAALYNAVMDAISPYFPVDQNGNAVECDLDFPLTSEKIWRVMRRLAI